MWENNWEELSEEWLNWAAILKLLLPPYMSIMWVVPLVITSEFASEISQYYHPCYIFLSFSFLSLTRWLFFSFEEKVPGRKLEKNIYTKCSGYWKICLSFYAILKSLLTLFKTFIYWIAFLSYGLNYARDLERGMRHRPACGSHQLNNYQRFWAWCRNSIFHKQSDSFTKLTPLIFFPSKSLERNIVLCL